MKTEKLEQLNQEFIRIRKMGYVKSSRKGVTGIGKTFEDLLGKKEDNLDMPDYLGIEIKTKLSYSNSHITLFNLTPNGNLETQRLCQTYGYPDKVLQNKKVLNISVTTTPTLIANKYFFNLRVDNFKKKIILVIKDRNNNLLEQSIYWSFDNLKEKLEKKLQFLALVNAWSTIRNGEKFYKYSEIKFYKLKTFENFIELINKGNIRISIKMGVFRTGLRSGLSHDRGTSFELKPLDFWELFDRIYI